MSINVVPLRPAGIERIKIDTVLSGRGAHRFAEAERLQPAADRIYQDVFGKFEAYSILPGTDSLSTHPRGFYAMLDRVLGIDVVLNFANGMHQTVQEKYLLSEHKTLTVEYEQDAKTGELGDWETCVADYVFCGYARPQADAFHSWVIADWSALKRATFNAKVDWSRGKNQHDGARASFKFVAFKDIPPSCVIASSGF